MKSRFTWFGGWLVSCLLFAGCGGARDDGEGGRGSAGITVGNGPSSTSSSTDATNTASTTAAASTASGSVQCNNGMKDGSESDVDCGGSCPENCAVGQGCSTNQDCVDAICDTFLMLCAAASCEDDVKNGGETGTDCGGPCEAGCATGADCADGTDCISGVCSALHKCLAPACDDMVKNGNETDVDCGGNCMENCAVGEGCNVPADCIEGVCDTAAHICETPGCTDLVKNGTETDVDCGGDCVANCATGKDCEGPNDCISGVCSALDKCVAPACDDNVQNGSETGVDCGGSCATNCAVGIGCTTGADCVEGVCDMATMLCAAPTCTDMVFNGNETDVDCGGPCPLGCGTNKNCDGAADCLSGVCSAQHKCVAPTCNDNVQNGTETDIDCGGMTCAANCAVGDGCDIDEDCTSDVCDSVSHLCSLPTCSDGTQNGSETDVDCGGACPADCAIGADCNIGSDCIHGVCSGGHLCLAATCSDGVRNGGEIGIDCGGACAARCPAGQPCQVPGDCVDQSCSASHVCLAATCVDGIDNGNETDIDCGGSCPDCNPGQHCTTAADCRGNTCTAQTCACPTGMIDAAITAGGFSCIDVGEVTYAEYDVFANGSILAGTTIALTDPRLPADCIANNSTWVPMANWPADPDPMATNSPTRPVRGVDWCDAYAYCVSKGKRLCGAIGGGSSTPAAFDDAGANQWFNACSAQGTNLFPYGDVYEGMSCITGAPMPEPRTATPDCVGGVFGLFNMSGNAAEWEDSCAGTGANRNCRVRGGSFADSVPADVRCDADRLEPYLAQSDEIGFRCCLP